MTRPSSFDQVSGFDLAIMGGTPAGIAMAVRTAREGGRVLLVNHTQHLGGMLANGLGVWDTRHRGKRAPIYDEVRQAILDFYRDTYGADSAQYRDALPGPDGHTNGKFEPRVAEQILTALVQRERDIVVLPGYFPSSVERDGPLLRAVTFRRMGGSASFRAVAPIFADCSYEGDLLALAGAPYRVGRESRDEYNEPHAGVVYMEPAADPPSADAARLAKMQADLNLRPFAGFQLLHPESDGSADANVQAMNYRVILTRASANVVPIARSDGLRLRSLHNLDLGPPIGPLPNRKLGLNRPQLLGPHNAYVEGDWEVRHRVMDAHWEATIALLGHVQNDPGRAPSERERWRGYGLARDEFADNGNRPYEIYIREGRRLVGRAMLTQHDSRLAPGIARPPVHRDSIAFTDWYVDSHACTPRRKGGSMEEGKVMLYQECFPGHVPYGALLPMGLDNLMVPVNLSATHVAWNTVRLEPTFMHIAEAAGHAVIQALRHNQAPAHINVDELQRTLVGHEIMLSFFNDIESTGDPGGLAAAQYFSARGFFPDFDARLHDPPEREVAAVWAQALKGAVLDSMGVARRVAAASLHPGGRLTWLELEDLLPAGRRGPPPTASRGGELTRGAFLALLWRQLNEGPATIADQSNFSS